MIKEQWRTIQEFPNYEVSNLGQVYNSKQRQMMRVSQSNFGHTKITLTAYDGSRHTRSVALLVAVAFVEPPNVLCDNLIMLDGDLTNVEASNLAWRPRWFAWKYVRQLKTPQPMYYHNLPVRNNNTNKEYQSIAELCITEGLLFDDVWRSTYTRCHVYPHGHTFEIIKRV